MKEKKEKRRYRRYIYGTHYYTHSVSPARAIINLKQQALDRIGKYELSNPLELEDPPKSKVYIKLGTKDERR